MPSAIRSRSVGPTLRRIAILALGPAGCGGSVAVPASNDASPGGPGDASSGAAMDDGASAPDAVAIQSPPVPYCGAPAGCDPANFAGAGTGECAAYWLSGDGCNGGRVLFPCGLPPLAIQSPCANACLGGAFNNCAVLLDGGQEDIYDAVDAGPVPAVVSCGYECLGRRPARLDGLSRDGGATVGDALAHGAYLEAASVLAFRELAAELEVHGAPRALIDRLRRAARDEIRHAAVTGALARARGGEVVEPCSHPSGARGLLAIALHNAHEGCVRETWGAACALVQARSAEDRDVRRAMGGIARDETAHAQLSWHVAAWLASRLTEEERALVALETERAVEELRAEVARPLPEPVRRALGLPSPCVAQSMLGAMRAEVWRDAAA
jgi:hypothetical protein